MMRVLACLVVLAGCVSHGRAENAAPKADFTETIPANGLTSTTQKVFWLKPGQVLEVVDETKKASFQPVPAAPAAAASTGGGSLFNETAEGSLNAVAFDFKDGACDFNRTIPYKNAFKKLTTYNKALWTPENITQAQPANNDTKKYRFTNPPEEFLDGVVSFCVRFNSTAHKSMSLRSVQDQSPSPDTRYLEIVIHSGAAAFTVKILAVLALTVAALGKSVGL